MLVSIEAFELRFLYFPMNQTKDCFKNDLCNICCSILINSILNLPKTEAFKCTKSSIKHAMPKQELTYNIFVCFFLLKFFLLHICIFCSGGWGAEGGRGRLYRYPLLLLWPPWLLLKTGFRYDDISSLVNLCWNNSANQAHSFSCYSLFLYIVTSFKIHSTEAYSPPTQS